jgi:hypothetical protein
MFTERKKILNFIILTIYLMVSSSGYSYSENSIQKLSIDPLNRVNINLSFLPEKFESTLSEDKLKITIKLEETSVNPNERQRSSTGVISDVTVSKVGKNSVISISLKEKRGYNAVILPYSKTLIVEVFQWNQLSVGEDKYRTGLLGFENKIPSVAIKDFSAAVKENIPNAAAFLGIIYLRLGKINSAELCLLLAEKSGSNINDLNAALSQVYTIKHDTIKSKEYEKKFIQKVGINEFQFLIIPEIIETDSIYTEETGYLKDLLSKSQPMNIVKDSIIKKVDSALISKNKITLVDSSSIKGFKISDYYEYALMLFFAILISVLYLYLKWRNKKLFIMKTNKGVRFGKDLFNQKEKIIPKKVSDIYKSNEQSEILSKQTPVKNNEYINIDLIDHDKKLADEKMRKEVETYLKNVRNQPKSKHDNIEDEFETLKEKSSPKPIISAKIELAMNLAEEQKKIKTRNLHELENINMPKDLSKLSEISKKLGIEKGGLETKQAIERLLADEDYLEKLKRKFDDEKNINN